MRTEVYEAAKPIDSRYSQRDKDADLPVFMAGFILGFVIALLLGVLFLGFAEIWSTQAEQPLSPFGEELR